MMEIKSSRILYTTTVFVVEVSGGANPSNGPAELSRVYLTTLVAKLGGT
jgi:hypothetical protein